MAHRTLSLSSILLSGDFETPENEEQVGVLLSTVDALDELFRQFPDAPADVVERKERFKRYAYRVARRHVEPL